jgi:hypothetical protein
MSDISNVAFLNLISKVVISKVFISIFDDLQGNKKLMWSVISKFSPKRFKARLHYANNCAKLRGLKNHFSVFKCHISLPRFLPKCRWTFIELGFYVHFKLQVSS